VVRLTRECEPQIPRVLSERLLAAGVSAGGDVLAAHASGVTRRSALGRLESARRASRETRYWLDLLVAADILSQEAVQATQEKAAGVYETLATLCAKMRQTLKAE